MGDNTERTITKTPDGEWTDGENTYRLPIRTFHIIADKLAVHAGATSHALVGDPEGELTAFSLVVRGLARMQRLKFGNADQVRSMSRPAEHTDKFSLHLHAFNGEPSDKRSTTVVLGFNESDMEFNDADDWFIQCGLPVDMLAELVSGIRLRRVSSLSIDIHFNDLYVRDNEYHAWPSSSVDWYLPPQKHRDGYRKETAAHGYIAALYWQERGLELKETEASEVDEGDTTPTLAEPSVAILQQLTQARIELGKSLERVSRILFVLSAAVIAIAIALLF